jgi:DNA-binding IscR family transcriptional regulator
LRIGASFTGEQRPATLECLAKELDVDEAFLAELLRALVAAGLIIRGEPSDDPRYVLSRSADRIRLKDVLDALRRSPGDADLAAQGTTGARAVQLWHDLDESIARAAANRTLAELIE